MSGTRGTETSKYPEEEKETSISKVAASEMERAQTEVRALRGMDRIKKSWDCQNGFGKASQRE